MRWFAAIVLVLWTACSSQTTQPQSEGVLTPSPIGKKIERFSLADAAGKKWVIDADKESKAVVVLFLGTQCPINNALIPHLVELHKEYAGKGVQFVAINANHSDSLERIKAHAEKFSIPFPVLRDVNGQIADRFGARRTPESFILDAVRVVRYHGRVHDQFGVAYQRPQPTRRDLQLALDDILAGKAVSVAETPVAGCLIARAPRPKREATVTYTKHVARIMQKNCLECHRPGQIGPMALTAYEDVANWSEMIKEVVQEGRMPPWHADPKHGRFANDRRLSDADRATLLAWIAQGCPNGDEKDLPEPAKFAQGWNIGEPDSIFTMEEEFKVPAKAGEEGVKYQHFVVKTKFDEDKWVQAAEAKPGNYAVVHHIIVYVIEPSKKRGPHPDGIGNGFLVAYAPGDLGINFEPGSAKKIPKGAVLVFQLHYTPNGTSQTDRSMVGFKFAKEPPKNEVRTRGIANQMLEIAPGAADAKVTSWTKFPEETILWSLLPHMHLRGKSFEYRAFYPDGKSEVLLSVPRYDFGWQANYRLATPLRLPAGTRIECTAYFDNSKNNPNNPDPNSWVYWGDQTWEEMMVGFVDYTTVSKEKQ
jgi:thiol-disulfide isomerase/thioredoxin/mono/diheme cytochrome c family protein